MDALTLTLREKLVEVYKKIDHIEKKGTNVKQNYKFVRSADVLRAIRNAFAELRVYAQTNVDLLGTYDIKTNSGGNMHTATVKVIIILHDLDSSETLTVSGIGDGADSGDKGVYKAQTGGIKNALRNAFLVPDEADPEADETVDIETEETSRATTKPRVLEVPYGTRPMETSPADIDDDFHDELPDETQLELPDETQLDKYRKKIQALTEELINSGALKASRNTPISGKILTYLLNTAGVSEAKQISVAQWTQILNFIDTIKTTENGLNKLGKLINDASKEKKE